jgi:hypothetical protein
MKQPALGYEGVVAVTGNAVWFRSRVREVATYAISTHQNGILE